VKVHHDEIGWRLKQRQLAQRLLPGRKRTHTSQARRLVDVAAEQLQQVGVILDEGDTDGLGIVGGHGGEEVKLRCG
jgi:hypothetical protein